MTTLSHINASNKIRVADFNNSKLAMPQTLSLPPQNGQDVKATIAQLRRYADLPFVYLFSKEQSEFVKSLLEQLGAIRSTCYPHALFITGADSVPEGLDPEALQLEIFTVSGADPDTIAAQISTFAQSTLTFEHNRLKFDNLQPLPTSVDVLIVGAGITGLYAAQQIKEKKLSFCIVDKREMIGGIWSQYANSTSQVNSSEGAYRLVERPLRSNRDHSMTREILEDMVQLAYDVRQDLFLNMQVDHIEKTDGGYATTITCHQHQTKISSKGIILAINDRVGQPRTVAWPGQEHFSGQISSGISDETKNMQWKGKKVVIVGMGAFAIENVRTALENGADHITVVCRRHGTVCPKIIDYLNFATPYDEDFQHPKKSNMRNMLLWKKLYKHSGATQPECWMGKIKHTGHTISVSDVWFIGHFLKKIETVSGVITDMYDRGVIVDHANRIEADIVINCVGFHRNASLVPTLCGYDQMTNINFIDKDFMYLADAFIDDDAFNSFFGSSVLEMAKFFMTVYLHFFDTPEYETLIQTEGVERIDVETRSWSQYIAGAKALVSKYDALRHAARTQVDQRSQNFHEAHDLEAYIAENKREWIDTHALLAGKPMREEDCLPYVFDKLLEEKF